MKNLLSGQVITVPISCKRNDPFPSNSVLMLSQNKIDSINHRLNKHGKRAENFVLGIREHVRIRSTISETVKCKMRLGAWILQLGGVKKVFKQIFGVGKVEKLMKASQCYLSTMAGPIACLLFSSSQRLAFCSEQSIKFPFPNGELVRFHYKVSVPLRR